MDVVGAIVAGLVGTAVMTVLMSLAPMVGLPKMDIISMLGSMLTTSRGAVNLAGSVLHFMMGAAFAIIYALLWTAGIGDATWLWGVIFGVVHGIVVALTMPVMMRRHPRPPEMELGPMALGGLLMAHAIFGLVVALVYAAF